MLSTYLIKILDKKKNEQILSRFNGDTDLMNVIESYLLDVFQNIYRANDPKEDFAVNLTLEGMPTIDREKRIIYGYFSTGISGEEFPIVNVDTKETVGNFLKNHAGFKSLFFYLKIPTLKKTGALILQRKSRFGVKTIVNNTLTKFFKGQGYQDYNLYLNNILHGKVYQKMIEEGKLKKIELIKRTLPSTMEEYFKNGENAIQISGILKTSLISTTSLPEPFKKFVNSLYSNARNQERIEILGGDNKYDEIEFELELNGKLKKFYVENRSRVQPDVDVTGLLKYEGGKPTLKSLIEQSEELIIDIIEVKPKNAK